MTNPDTSASPLEQHIADYLGHAVSEAGKPIVGSLAIVDAIEHGWYGATATIAERLDGILERAANDAEHVPTLHRAILARLVRELTDELKVQVHA